MSDCRHMSTLGKKPCLFKRNAKQGFTVASISNLTVNLGGKMSLINLVAFRNGEGALQRDFSNSKMIFMSVLSEFPKMSLSRLNFSL